MATHYYRNTNHFLARDNTLDASDGSHVTPATILNSSEHLFGRFPHAYLFQCATMHATTFTKQRMQGLQACLLEVGGWHAAHSCHSRMMPTRHLYPAATRAPWAMYGIRSLSLCADVRVIAGSSSSSRSTPGEAPFPTAATAAPVRTSAAPALPSSSEPGVQLRASFWSWPCPCGRL